MPASSGTYNFQSIQAEIIIREAYERIGMLGDLVVSQQFDSAVRSINFLLTEWSNRNVNLWTLQNSYLALSAGQPSYILPIQTAEVSQVNLRTSARQNFGGEGATSSGVLGEVFLDDGVIPCVQDAVNGNISYNYGAGNTQTLTFLGIQAGSILGSPTYNIVFEGSNLGILGSWTTLLTIPEQVYPKGIIQWFDVFNITPYRYYRIKETSEAGLGRFLDIQKLYFNSQISDTSLSEISRYEYNTFPQKHQVGRPTTYYMDRQINPVMYLWPTPALQYNCVAYSWQQMIQDVGSYTDSIQVPADFYEGLVAGLAYKLAVKYKPEMVGMLKQEYDSSFQTAVTENSEDTPIRIYGDYSAGRYR